MTAQPKKPAELKHAHRNVCLPRAVVDQLRALGNGNLSAGIRRAAELAKLSENGRT